MYSISLNLFRFYALYEKYRNILFEKDINERFLYAIVTFNLISMIHA